MTNCVIRESFSSKKALERVQSLIEKGWYPEQVIKLTKTPIEGSEPVSAFMRFFDGDKETFTVHGGRKVDKIRFAEFLEKKSKEDTDVTIISGNHRMLALLILEFLGIMIKPKTKWFEGSQALFEMARSNTVHADAQRGIFIDYLVPAIEACKGLIVKGEMAEAIRKELYLTSPSYAPKCVAYAVRMLQLGVPRECLTRRTVKWAPMQEGLRILEENPAENLPKVIDYLTEVNAGAPQRAEKGLTVVQIKALIQTANAVKNERAARAFEAVLEGNQALLQEYLAPQVS